MYDGDEHRYVERDHKANKSSDHSSVRQSFDFRQRNKQNRRTDTQSFSFFFLKREREILLPLSSLDMNGDHPIDGAQRHEQCFFDTLTLTQD